MAAHSTPAADSSRLTPRWRAPFICGTAALAALAVCTSVALLPPAVSSREALLLAALTIGALVGVRAAIRLGGTGITISGELAPIVAAAVVSPELVPFIALAAFAAPAPSRSIRLLGGSQVLVAACAAAAAATVTSTGLVSTALISVIAFVMVNAITVIAYEVIVWHERVATMLALGLGTTIATTVVTFPIVALGAWLIDDLGAGASALLFLPLAATQYFHLLYHRKVQLTEELAEKAQMLARTNLQFAAAMVRALDMRDAYTAGHSAAVAVYTRDIAREMGFDDETVRLAHLAGLLHDIGKIGVPGRVLNKTAPLDDEEYELMKSHAAMGASILGDVDLYADIALIVRYHHERIDGRGYPDGISGEAIPAVSRMISVADTYSAMTTDRPYREGMPTEKAMSILRECRGTQLDQDFTDAFLRILIVADEAYQRGKQTDFDVEVAKHQALSEVEAEAVRIDAPPPAGPDRAEPLLPAAVDGVEVEVELEREAA